MFGLVTEAGQPVFTGAVGSADLDDPRPIAAHDRFRIGSVTKMYAATLVLQVVADGLLALDDTVEKLLPGLVPDGADVTVEMLLRLRSGLPDYTSALFGDPPNDLSVLGSYWSPRRLVTAALASGDRLPADRRYRYSNTDYILFGLMVEQATGERVDAQMCSHLQAVEPGGHDVPHRRPVPARPACPRLPAHLSGRPQYGDHGDDPVGVVDRRRYRGHRLRHRRVPRRTLLRRLADTGLPPA